MENFEDNILFAKQLDEKDELSHLRSQFSFPKKEDGTNVIYFCGNSLGLQPKAAINAVQQEMNDWANLAVEAHFRGNTPWTKYNEYIAANMATIVGAKANEVVLMNTLTANLHAMMVSFYSPTKKRNKILIDYNPFPSDRYAIASQIKWHGYEPTESIVEPTPDENACVATTQIIDIINKHGNEIALVMIGGVNYYSGQVYDMQAITAAAKAKGCKVGFDLAHAVGNIPMELHNWNVDFAVWCTYKYLNGGPGAIAGCFIHEQHHANKDLNRMEGWYGVSMAERFKMKPTFIPANSAEAWCTSNQPILSLAPVKASLEMFNEVGFTNLRNKSIMLTQYLYWLLIQANIEGLSIITPKQPDERGCQLSIRIKNGNKTIFEQLLAQGIIGDWREPDVIRVAPVPMYNSFEDVWQFVQILKRII